MSDQVKIRIQGCPQQVEMITAKLRRLVHIVEQSDAYQDQEDLQFIKRYLTVQVARTEELRW